MRTSGLLSVTSLCLLAIGGRADEPATARGYYERALVHEQNRRYTEAITDYSKAIELDPQFVEAYFSRSSLYAGHPALDKREYAKAVADLTKILEIDPKGFSVRFNRALAYESLREYDKAIADYTKVIEGGTDFSRNGDGKDKCLAHTHHYRGRAYQWYKRDNIKAVADYTEALRLDPEMEMVHYRRGQARHALKDFANAQADFAKALTRDPDYPNLLNSWAWQLATCPDPKFRDGRKALEYARKSNEKSGGKRPECLDTVAAAYAEAGQFDEAIKSQKKAIELLDPKADEQRKAMQARLKLYEAGRRFRTE